jgi:hypothetical protein
MDPTDPDSDPDPQHWIFVTIIFASSGFEFVCTVKNGTTVVGKDAEIRLHFKKGWRFSPSQPGCH